MESRSLHSVNEELVTAYLDGDASQEERRLVENAMAADERVLWEVNSLSQTVELLRDQPEPSLPRSFVLTEDQVADSLAERRSRSAAAASGESVGTDAPASWLRLFSLFYGGNLALRNAAAVAALLLLIVTAAEPLLSGPAAGALSFQDGQPPQSSTGPAVRVTSVGFLADSSTSNAPDAQAEPTPQAPGEDADGSSEFGVMSTGAQGGGEETREQAAGDGPAASAAGEAAAAPRAEQNLAAPLPPTAAGADQGLAEAPFWRAAKSALLLMTLALAALWLGSRAWSRESRA